MSSAVTVEDIKMLCSFFFLSSSQGRTKDLQLSAESQASWKRSTASSFQGPKETEQIHPHERGGQIFRGFCVLKARLIGRWNWGGCWRGGGRGRRMHGEMFLRPRNGRTSAICYVKNCQIPKLPEEISESGLGNYSQELLPPPLLFFVHPFSAA